MTRTEKPLNLVIMILKIALTVSRIHPGNFSAAVHQNVDLYIQSQQISGFCNGSAAIAVGQPHAGICEVPAPDRLHGSYSGKNNFSAAPRSGRNMREDCADCHLKVCIYTFRIQLNGNLLACFPKIYTVEERIVRPDAELIDNILPELAHKIFPAHRPVSAHRRHELNLFSGNPGFLQFCNHCLGNGADRRSARNIIEDDNCVFAAFGGLTDRRSTVRMPNGLCNLPLCESRFALSLKA